MPKLRFIISFFLGSFQAKCEAFQSAIFAARSFDLEGVVSIDVTNVQFKRSMWFINSSLSFLNCDIKVLTLQMHGLRSHKGTCLHISQSRIGAPIFVHSATVTLENCTMEYAESSAHTTSFHTFNCTITIQFVQTAHFQGAFFLVIDSGGNAYISNVDFINSSATFALFSVLHESMLSVDHCTFISNKNVLINVESFSRGIITNSSIDKNILMFGKWIKYHIRGIKGGILEIKMSHFSNNAASFGLGVIGCIEQCSVNVDNCQFMKNQGPALFEHNASNISTTSSTFSGNTALHAGAAIMVMQTIRSETHSLQSTAQVVKRLGHWYKNMLSGKETVPVREIRNCTFAENIAGRGGAIAIVNVSFLLIGNHFANNTAIGDQGREGAVWLLHSATNITNCTFNGNKAPFGGGVTIQGELAHVSPCTFTRNEALKSKISQGGAVAIQLAAEKQLEISKSFFHENKATHAGGAICVAKRDNTDGLSSVEGCTFSRNWAGFGGAIACYSANITTSHFEGNSAVMEGGALASSRNSQISVTLCSFAHNSAGIGGAIWSNNNASLYVFASSFQNNSAYPK